MNLFVRIMLVLCCALIPAVGVALYNESALRQERESEIRAEALRAAAGINDELIRIADAVRNSLVALTDNTRPQLESSPDCAARLADVMEASAYLADLRVADTNGHIVCAGSGDPSADESAAGRGAFQLVRDTESFSIGTYRPAGPGHPRLLELGYPLFGADGAVRGVLLAGISIDWLLDMLRRKPLPTGSSVAIVDRNATFVARLPDDDLTGRPQPEPYRAMLEEAQPGTLEGIGSDGVRRVVGYMPLSQPPAGLLVSVGFSVEQSFAAIDAAWRRGVILIGLGAAGAVLLAWALTHRLIGRGVQDLVAAANRWRDGDLTARTRIVGRTNELRRVATAFDEMADRLEQRSRAVQETEERFELARAAAGLGIWDWDVATNVLTWSPQNWILHGRDPRPSGLSYADWIDYVHPDDLKAAELSIKAALRDNGPPLDVEYRIRCADGGTRWLLGRGLVLRKDGRPVRMVGINMDITARKQAEEAVANSMRLLRQTHRLAGTGSFERALPSEVLTVSEEWLHICGFPAGTETVTVEAAIGRILPEDQPVVREQLDAVLRPGGPAYYELEYAITRRSDGAIRRVASAAEVIRDRTGNAVRLLGVLRDVTEERQAEDALRTLNAQLERRVQEEVAAREEAYQRLAHAERIQALGQLAGGIAHDFNNVLAVIQGASELIATRRHVDDAVRRLARVALDAARRGAAITGRLLSFGRQSDLKAEPLDPAQVLTAVREVLPYTIGKAITIETTCPDGLPRLMADQSQLETVLVNLATNARDAMPSGGSLTLTAAAETVDGGGDHPPELQPGRYIRLTVRDTGTGMDPVTLARVAEPFFTTKEPGRGTGLGLPMAKSFAEQSGGAMAIASACGLGTTVTLWLPQADSPSLAAPRPRPPEPGSRRRSELAVVLLVDDEPLVREVTAVALEDAGYIVLAAENATEALALLDVEERVDILITDLSMPGMDGIALIRAVRDKHPALPAILVTGFAGEAASSAAFNEMGDTFVLLRKPVTQEQLRERVASMIVAGVSRREA